MIILILQIELRIDRSGKTIESLFYFLENLHKADNLGDILKMNIMIFILFISENPFKALIWSQKEQKNGYRKDS